MTVFELTMHFKHEMIEIWTNILKKLRIKWNFELTMFELTVPDLYLNIASAQTAGNSCQAGNHHSWYFFPCFQISIFYDIYFLPPMLTMYPALSLQRISRWQHTRLKQMMPSLISTHFSSRLKYFQFFGSGPTVNFYHLLCRFF